MENNKAASMTLTLILTAILVLSALISLAGCGDNSVAVNNRQPAAVNIIQIYYYDSLNNSQSYEGPFRNMQYGFEHVFLYRDGYKELKIPVTNILSININPDGQ